MLWATRSKSCRDTLSIAFGGLEVPWSRTEIHALSALQIGSRRI